ncbi:MAG: nuclear transport factor 2 family protein [Bacteroidota bacterium]
MKKVILAITILASTLACNNTDAPKSQNKQDMNTIESLQAKEAVAQTAIKELLIQLFRAVDERDWAGVASTMASKVYTDYSALGGEPGFQSPTEIIEGWHALLPGFERTLHQPHNFAIWVAGERATATLDALASHYLSTDSGENVWTVFVGYDTEFIMENGKWKLARIDLSLYDQAGNQELPQLAMQNVQNNQIPAFSDQSAAQAPVERFFKALEARNLDAVLAEMDKNVVQTMPFSPNNFPKSLNGKAAMKQQYSGVMDYQQQYERHYLPTRNPNIILVQYSGTIITNEGKDYNNSYIGIFETNTAGKIVRFTEYFSPTILLNSWPGLQPEHYSVHAAGAARSGVQMEEVSFSSKGLHLKGHLFLPSGFDASRSYPAVIITGSWTSVKEQMPDAYASLLAEQGLIALTFDFTGFGESEGQPRQLEDYHLKIEDIKSAVTYLSGHKNVNQEQLSGLGICASAGYMAHAVAQDSRIKQLALVAPWLHNAELARGIYDMRPGGTDGLLAAARSAKEQYATTGEMDYVLAASELDPLSAMFVPENAFDYYLNPGKAAGGYYDNRFAVSSWEPWLTFDGIGSAADISQPVLVVHSESGAIPQGTKLFYDQLQGQKDIIWLNEFNQQQLYFEAAAIGAAIAQVRGFLLGQ